MAVRLSVLVLSALLTIDGLMSGPFKKFVDKLQILLKSGKISGILNGNLSTFYCCRDVEEV